MAQAFAPLVFGVGVYLHFSAPRNSLQWVILVLLMAFAAWFYTIAVALRAGAQQGASLTTDRLLELCEQQIAQCESAANRGAARLDHLVWIEIGRAHV